MAEYTPLMKEEASAPPPAPPYQDTPQYRDVPQYQDAPHHKDSPPAYSQPQQPQQPPVILVPSQQVVVTSRSFGDAPTRLTCPNCRNEILTRLEYTPGGLTWLIIGLLLFLGFWGGCCLIPLCIDGVKDVNHFCPTCNCHVGTFKRL